jgi:hypothetical protein
VARPPTVHCALRSSSLIAVPLILQAFRPKLRLSYKLVYTQEIVFTACLAPVLRIRRTTLRRTTLGAGRVAFRFDAPSDPTGGPWWTEWQMKNQMW